MIINHRTTGTAIDKRSKRSEYRKPGIEKNKRFKEVEDIRNAVTIMQHKIDRLMKKTTNTNLSIYLFDLQRCLNDGIKIVDFVYESIKKC